MYNHGCLSLIILLLSYSCFAGQQEAFPHGLWTSLKGNTSSVLSARGDVIPLQHRADAQQQPLDLTSFMVQRGPLNGGPQPPHTMPAWMRAMLQYCTDLCFIQSMSLSATPAIRAVLYNFLISY